VAPSRTDALVFSPNETSQGGNMLTSGSGCSLCDIREGPDQIYAIRETWIYRRCSNCGLVSLRPMPDETTLRHYYNADYSVPATRYARGMERSAPFMLAGLRERFSRRGKLLEIGCSYGLFLDAARQDGWDVTGIELDDHAAACGREKLGLRVFSGTLESESSRLDPPYDAIVSFHVIEHVRDPVGFLRLCRRLIQEDGVLILKTPNVASWIAETTGAHWAWLSPPAHLHLFSPQALEFALKKTGFRVEGIWSRRGDANNNLFELIYAAGRHMASKNRGAAGKGGANNWSDRWQVRAVRAVSEAVYFPMALLIDPWLGRKGLQPELVAVARG